MLLLIQLQVNVPGLFFAKISGKSSQVLCLLSTVRKRDVPFKEKGALFFSDSLKIILIIVS